MRSLLLAAIVVLTVAALQFAHEPRLCRIEQTDNGPVYVSKTGTCHVVIEE